MTFSLVENLSSDSTDGADALTVLLELVDGAGDWSAHTSLLNRSLGAVLLDTGLLLFVVNMSVHAHAHALLTLELVSEWA